jgi:hypothetical protein
LDYFPHCRFRDPVEVGPLTVYPCLETDERFRAYFSSDKKTDDQASLWPDYFWWIVKILITGILIVLGGPFWYDAVRGLARATQLLRGRAQPQQTPTGSLPGEETPAQPAEIFKRYVEKTPDGGRIQPQPDST